MQQQQELLKPVLSAIAPPIDEELSMAYGCRNCETLKRQLEQAEAEISKLRAKVVVDQMDEIYTGTGDS